MNLAYLSQVQTYIVHDQNVSCSLPLVSLCGVLFKEYLFGKVDFHQSALPGSSQHSRRSDCSAKRMTCNIAWRLAFEGLNEADLDTGMILESVDTRGQKRCCFYMMLVCLMRTHVRA